MSTKEYKKRRRPFSEIWLRGLKKPKQGDVYWTDATTTGLSFHITHTDRRTFRYLYRMGGSTRKMTLGTYPHMDLLAAQTEVARCVEMIREGTDPITEQEEVREEKQREDSKTFGLYAEAYAVAVLKGEKVRRSKNGPGTISEDGAKTRARDLRNVVIPAIGHNPIKKLTRAKIAEFLDKVEAGKGAKTRVDRMLAVINGVFNYAMFRGYIDENPARSIDTRAICTPRKHHLNDDEIKVVWDAAGSLGDAYGALIQMLLITGQRRGEMAKSKWGAVDFEKAILKFPADITKARRDHAIPLTQPALDVLLALPRGDDDSLIFGPYPLDNWDRHKRRIAKLTKDARPWRIHDLRRTVATGLENLGYTDLMVATILNHAPSRDMITTLNYIDANPVMKKQAPMEAWADKVMKIVNPPPPGDNVTKIRKTA